MKSSFHDEAKVGLSHKSSFEEEEQIIKNE